MFISYEFVNFILNEEKHQFRIVDDDFIHVGIAPLSFPWGELIETVINTYQGRKLPVAPNLMKAFIFEVNKHSPVHGYTVADIMQWYKRQPSYKIYGKDMEKYLILL